MWDMMYGAETEWDVLEGALEDQIVYLHEK